ncbi:MAG: histidine phosphatase family protein, partial [Desulfobulbaceae bacterium]
MAKRLLLLRHAATPAGNESRLVGSTDVPASPAGLDEMRRLAGVLERFSPHVWYCSPLRRARQTAARLREVYPPAGEVVVDERLREIDFGRWEMQSFADIAAADPEGVRRWTEFDGFVFPGGEGVGDFQERVAEVLAELSGSDTGEIGVITHGGVIRSMICLALGLHPAKYLLFDVRPAALTVIDLHGARGVLTG